jgi:plasmid stabilization system protein ParE
MHKYSVRITPSAIEDIEMIADFYMELVDEDSAVKFTEDVIATIESLDTFPEGNAYFDEEHGLRRVRLKHHKVSVVYLVDNGVYEVVAFSVFHSSAEPNKYTQRIVERLKRL